MLPKRLARKTVYQNQWVNLYLDTVEFPDGRVIEEHHLLEFEYDSVGVVVQNEHDEVLLIRAGRYTTQTLEWEIPAGGVEAGETPEQAARREVMEETGCELNELTLLCSEHPLNGIANKTHHIYRALVKTQGEPTTPEEILGKRWFAKAELRRLIKDGDIRCDLSLIGVLMVLCDF